MADNTHIEWTDATWNPITGCSVVSPGCTNCYAMKLAGGRLQHHPTRAGLTHATKAGPVWTGEVRLNEDQLTQPLLWKRARRIFVCAHGDLFHESVPDEWIDRVFAVMALSPQHTFQVLTKRSARMRAYMQDRAGKLARFMIDEFLVRGSNELSKKRAINAAWPVRSIGDIDDPDDVTIGHWPLLNVWLGVSAEDQARADERIPDLLATPAAVRFLSAEPLLGPIELNALGPAVTTKLPAWAGGTQSLRHSCLFQLDGSEIVVRLDWVIVGGESGPSARPMHPDWARQIRDDCDDAGVAFFFKQWGAHAWAERVEGDPSTLTAYRAGKKAAGRHLEGAVHDAMPGQSA